VKKLLLACAVLVALPIVVLAQTSDWMFGVVDPRSEVAVGIVYDFLGPPYSTGGLLLVPEKSGYLATTDDVTSAVFGLASEEDLQQAIASLPIASSVACADDGRKVALSCDNVCSGQVMEQKVDPTSCSVADDLAGTCSASAPSGDAAARALCCVCGPVPAYAYRATVTPVATASSVFAMAWTDLEGDGSQELVYIDRAGTVYVQDLATGNVEWSYPIGHFPYALRVHNLDVGAADTGQNAGQEILVLTAADALHVFRANGSLRWTHPGTAPLYSVAAGHLLDTDEVHVAVAGEDMKVTILDAGGSLEHQIDVSCLGLGYQLPSCTLNPIFQSTTVELAGRSIRAMDAGDVDGDGIDELLVANQSRRFGLLDARQPASPWLWSGIKDTSHTSYKGSMAFTDARLLDLVAEGEGPVKKEVFLAGRASKPRVLKIDASTGAYEWHRDVQLTLSGPSGYRNPTLGTIQVGGGAPELAVLSGYELFVFEPIHGIELYGNGNRHYAFNVIAASPSPADEVLVGSITGSDRNVYRIQLSSSAPEDELRLMTDADIPGRRAEINDHLAALRQEVMNAADDTGTPLPPADKRVKVWLGDGGPTNTSGLNTRRDEQDRFEAIYGNSRIRFIHGLAYKEYPLHNDPNLLNHDQLIALAHEIRSKNVDHVLSIAHDVTPGMTRETVLDWIDAAQETLVGVLASEIPIERYYTHDRSQIAAFEDFVDDFLIPIIDELGPNQKLYLLMKQNFWVLAPNMNPVASKLFAPGRRNKIVPIVEESNSRAPENNLMARVGLWRSGYFPSWGVNMIDDQLRVSVQYEYEPADPHHMLRHLVAYASAGATDFKIKLGGHTRDWFDKFDDTIYSVPPTCGPGQEPPQPPDCDPAPAKGRIAYTDYGLLGQDLFLRLVSKGLLDIPSQERIAGLSPAAWCFRELLPGWDPEEEEIELYAEEREFVWASALPMPLPWIPVVSRDGLFTGFEWMLHETRSTYANKRILNVPRYGWQMIPETPYGLPTMIPKAVCDDSAQTWIQTKLETDGVRLFDANGDPVANAADAAEDAFENAASQLPVRAAGGVFAMSTIRDANTYRVTLMGTDYLEPEDATAVLTTIRPIESLTDAITGASLSFNGSSASVPVDAGSIRIVDVELEPVQ
jgi:hypothetical protein